ncbi:MAG: cobalt-precorrin 5A hydrolase [Desulfobacterales bacterium]|jgi:cobalt-precorrin 5A hydrolase
MPAQQKDKTAIWVITPNGVVIAQQIKKHLTEADIYISAKIKPDANQPLTFHKLSDAMTEKFRQYSAHIFIMATGIVVRVIAPYIQNKTEDPGVVVVDDQGRHVISLLAGHLGGANDLTRKIAAMIEADPVITAATDVNEKPAIDVLAKEKKLTIDNPPAIKSVNMALLTDRQIGIHDPFAVLQGNIPNAVRLTPDDLSKKDAATSNWPFRDHAAAIYVDDQQIDLPTHVLVLRPATLVAGIGCNRNTPMEEIKALLNETLKRYQLARSSLNRLATIELKADEPALIDLAKTLKVPIEFFSRAELSQVEDIQSPSAMVEKHVGVKSVCEAAAILASQMGDLVVPKQSTPNVTVAIARKAYI